jgi:hypothetical protein
MANSTASIIIKPTVALNRGDTFVFGSWVCTAEVVRGTLAEKFGEILLYNQHTDFKYGSASNSNSMPPLGHRMRAGS